MNFHELGLKAELVKAVEELGFEQAMPIQAQAIPPLLEGTRDLVGLAQTGTGKTGAFGLPLLQRIDPAKKSVQALVVCPTRELCLQITDDLRAFAAHLDHIRMVAVYGGASITAQIKQLRQGAQIIVATPGRLLDLMRRNAADLTGVDTVVLDEADEMLNLGFKDDIELLFRAFPTHRKVWLFSATMGREVARIASTYLDDPVEITVGDRNQTAPNIEHTWYMVHEKHRYQALKRLMDFSPDMYGLIFCRTRIETQKVAEALMQDGYRADALHGDLSQAQRDYVMRKFRQRNLNALVATDVAARGLDVDDITHVIHYRLPDDAEVYTHRSGRTARAGKSGRSLALINTREMRRLRELAGRADVPFQQGAIPGGREICEVQLFAMVDSMLATEVNEEEIADYLPAVYAKLGELDKEELIRRFVSAEFNHFLDYYRHAGDINVAPRAQRDAPGPQMRRGKADRFTDRGPRPERLRSSDTQRLFINIGRMDDIQKGAIVRLVCELGEVSGDQIGNITLNREFSFFEVEKSAAEQVMDRLNKAKFDGRHIKVAKAQRKMKKGGKDKKKKKKHKKQRPDGD